MVSKALIQKYKDKVHAALKDFDYTIDNCSRETPRAVARLLNELEDAVNANVLHIEEEKKYKKLVSDRVIQFEKKCGCNKRIIV